MASTSAYRNHAKVLPNNDDNLTPFSTPTFRPTSRRNPSLLSSPASSSSSNNSSSSRSLHSFHDPFEESPVFSPTTPLNFSGIPFSWEQTPGIPKNEIVSYKKQSSIIHSFLPLPPPGGYLRKNCKGESSNSNSNIRKDPFFAALIECSKDIDHQKADGGIHDEKMYHKTTSKGLNDRLMATISCKSSVSSAVSESMIYLPAQSRRYQHLAKRRSI